jgi:hypothetical protein
MIQASIIAGACLLTGCASIFACETKATYTVHPDGTREISYSSCKEQIGLEAILPDGVHVRVDKSSTQEAAMAAALQLHLKLADMLQQLQAIIAKGALMGGS